MVAVAKTTFGPYCFKATCALRLRGNPVGKFVGYGRGAGTAKMTKDACEARLDNLDGEYSCGVTDLVFVHGQDPEPGVFFVTDAGATRIA
jgi:hypothetical protein